MICFTSNTSLTHIISSITNLLDFQVHLDQLPVFSKNIMGFRFPQIVQAKKFLRQSSISISQSSTMVTDVPKGHLAVYIGESARKRFIIPVSFLNRSSFQDMLRQAEEEFGFDHPMGGLTIPCREDIFIDLISQLSMA